MWKQYYIILFPCISPSQHVWGSLKYRVFGTPMALGSPWSSQMLSNRLRMGKSDEEIVAATMKDWGLRQPRLDSNRIHPKMSQHGGHMFLIVFKDFFSSSHGISKKYGPATGNIYIIYIWMVIWWSSRQIIIQKSTQIQRMNGWMTLSGAGTALPHGNRWRFAWRWDWWDWWDCWVS